MSLPIRSTIKTIITFKVLIRNYLLHPSNHSNLIQLEGARTRSIEKKDTILYIFCIPYELHFQTIFQPFTNGSFDLRRMLFLELENDQIQEDSMLTWIEKASISEEILTCLDHT